MGKVINVDFESRKTIPNFLMKEIPTEPINSDIKDYLAKVKEWENSNRYPYDHVFKNNNVVMEMNFDDQQLPYWKL